MQYSKLLIISIMLLLTACHTVDPLEKFNRKIYSFNHVIHHRLIKPIVVIYHDVSPTDMNIMLLNSRKYIHNVFSTPLYLIKGYSYIDIYQRMVIDLLLGGVGTTALSNTLYKPFPVLIDNSWPIVLPFLNPMGTSSLGGIIITYTIMSSYLPASILATWLYGTRLAKEDSLIEFNEYLDRQVDPYKTFIYFMRKPMVSSSETFALPQD